jgi:hypothetical protein
MFGGGFIFFFGVYTMINCDKTNGLPFQNIFWFCSGALIDFIQFCSDGDASDTVPRQGSPLAARQHLLLELKVHELVTEAIFRLRPLVTPDQFIQGSPSGTASSGLNWKRAPRKRKNPAAAPHGTIFSLPKVWRLLHPFSPLWIALGFYS